MDEWIEELLKTALASPEDLDEVKKMLSVISTSHSSQDVQVKLRKIVSEGVE